MTTEIKHALQNRIIAETYKITCQLGAGGMGSIYEAEHVRMGRKFALKLLDPAFAENEEVFNRFKREAEIAGQLGHPNIVDVVDFDRTEEGIPYIVMEKLEGEDLADWIGSKGAMTFQRAYPIIAEIVDALEAAHAAGVVHRDMKPQNIFLCKHGRRNDFVKLLDFGISKMKQSGSIVTRTNAVMGTPYYMSPEQAEGKNKEIDTRTDIFALGAIIYEMLTGKLAFYAPSVPTAMFKVCYEEPEPIENLVTGLPDGLPAVLAKALAKDKNERYASARALGDDLERIYEGQMATFDAGVAHKVLTDPDMAGHPLDPTTLSGSASQVMDATTMSQPKSSNMVAIVLAVVGIVAIVGAAIFVVTSLKKDKKGNQGPRQQAATAPMSDMDADDMKPLSNEVTLTFYITPTSASLFLDDKENTEGKGNLERVIKMKRIKKPIKVKVTAKGYSPRLGTVIPVSDQQVTISLYKEGQVPAMAQTGFTVMSPPTTGRRRRRRRRAAGTSGGGSMRASPMVSEPRRAPPRVMARTMRGGGAAADDI